MNRRTLLGSGGALWLSGWGSAAFSSSALGKEQATASFQRTRPTDRAWPSAGEWKTLGRAVGGRLAAVDRPLAGCFEDPKGTACTDLFAMLKNPYFVSDTAGLTQTLGWVDAWTSAPSLFAVTAQSASDVAAAVRFARRHRLRLVIRGGGHSYQGGSNAPQSLMIWTRGMRKIDLHDDFIAQGCEGKTPASPAVSLGAGALWIHAYQAVTTQAGRYVQGGGCTTVGVAGLVQGGGFGSFSKGFGLAAANLLEAEIVTADGQVRIANSVENPDLFWALKGGGGGSFGVVTRLTLRTHPLPTFFGAAQATITAKSDLAYHALVDRLMSFYQSALFNEHWGEQISFQARTVSLNLVFQGLTQAEAKAAWAPFFDWAAGRPDDYTMTRPLILALPARKFWDAAFLKALPGLVGSDTRPGAPLENVFWSGDGAQVAQVIHGYQSAWLPQTLLGSERRGDLVQALAEAAGQWRVSLHFNKGLAGGSPEARAAAEDTSINPAVRDAFALVIVAAHSPPAYPGVAGHEPDLEKGRRDAQAITRAMAPLKRLLSAPASYLSEGDYFDPDWRQSAWGEHYPRLSTIKSRYDPEDLFIVHHGVGSERWSADGFTRLTS